MVVVQQFFLCGAPAFGTEGLNSAAGNERKLLEWSLGSWKREKWGFCRKPWPRWPGCSYSSGQCSSVHLDGYGEHEMLTGWQLGCCDFLCGRVLILPRKAELVIVLSGGWESQKNAASIYSSGSFNSVPATSCHCCFHKMFPALEQQIKITSIQFKTRLYILFV